MAEDRVGQVLVETYRIERLHAEGGMGSVYEARHLRLPKRFAVKFLNLNLIANHEAQARFRREAEIVAQLDHPNVVTLFDYNVTAAGVPFIVLEFLDGEHLGRRIARGRVPLAEATPILAQVVEALSAAHERNIVHRDLKPENVVLVRGGERVKVVDFGIAKIRDGQELTASNTILGTVPYMAPEQLFGSAVDARADQFALGAIAYEMLAGEMAFGGAQSVPEVAARVASYDPPLIAGVPRAVSEVVLRALAKDAAARFPSVGDFLDALAAAAAAEQAGPDELDGLDSPDELAQDEPPLPGDATLLNVVPALPPRGADERASLGEDTSARQSPRPRSRRDLDDDTGSFAIGAPGEDRGASVAIEPRTSPPRRSPPNAPTRQLPEPVLGARGPGDLERSPLLGAPLTTQASERSRRTPTPHTPAGSLSRGGSAPGAGREDPAVTDGPPTAILARADVRPDARPDVIDETAQVALPPATRLMPTVAGEPPPAPPRPASPRWIPALAIGVAVAVALLLLLIAAPRMGR